MLPYRTHRTPGEVASYAPSDHPRVFQAPPLARGNQQSWDLALLPLPLERSRLGRDEAGPWYCGNPGRSISWVRFLEACFGLCSGVMVADLSDYRHKRHNVSSLLYHIVCPAKYRRVIFDAAVDTVLKDVCLDIAKRYDIAFLEIGTDTDHVHFLVQSVPSYSPTKIVKTIKSLTAREIFHRVPTVNKRLWGGELWSKGYFISTVGRHGHEAVIRQYVKQQGSAKG